MVKAYHISYRAERNGSIFTGAGLFTTDWDITDRPTYQRFITTVAESILSEIKDHPDYRNPTVNDFHFLAINYLGDVQQPK